MLDPWLPPLQPVSITIGLADGSFTLERDALWNVPGGMSRTNSVFSKPTAMVDSYYSIPEFEVKHLRAYGPLAGAIARRR